MLTLFDLQIFLDSHIALFKNDARRLAQGKNQKFQT
jgi:hypothetical protein